MKPTLYRAGRALRHNYKMRRNNDEENLGRVFQAEGIAKSQQLEWDWCVLGTEKRPVGLKQSEPYIVFT